AANHEPVVELVAAKAKCPGTPSKAKLRPKVALLGIELAATSADSQVGELICACSEVHCGKQVVLFGDRAKVFPTKSCRQSQVRPHLVIVLEKQSDDVIAQVFAECGRNTGLGIGLGALAYGGIVEKIPDVVELVRRPVCPKRSINRKQAGK